MRFVLPEYNYAQHLLLVTRCIDELLVKPRFAFKEWSALTHQTPAAKTGYSYQHLASVVTNIRGRGSAARGEDLTDGTEVKACSRVNQLDTCKNPKCKAGVMRSHTVCGACGGTAIRRNNDSKWLITLRSQKELDTFCGRKRALFVIEDYPEFEKQNYKDMRIRVYEIYPHTNAIFQTLLRDYYQNTFLPNAKKRVSPAPKNFWPDSFSFHICSPVKVMEATVLNFEQANYEVRVSHLAAPGFATDMMVEPMPTALLTEGEREVVRSFLGVSSLPAFLDVEQRSCLELR